MKKISQKKNTKKEFVPWIIVKRKSKAGVEYISYVPPETLHPKGFNYLERKKLDAMNKRIKEGREYYIVGKGGVRIYNEK